MSTTDLFSGVDHRNLLLPEYGEGVAVQANQHLIVDNGEGILLDPGGHKVYSKVLGETLRQLGQGKLRYLLLSHQDPDVVAATNGWLMTTNAVAYASQLWTRFIPHFGIDKLVADRLVGVPDKGLKLPLGKSEVWLMPGHFLHSPGNLHLYDPTSKIYYSGDLGASIGQSYSVVSDFDSHLTYMEGFHRRYMASNSALRAWVHSIRKLEIETIAPQHGAFFKGPDMVTRFLAWAYDFKCGVDYIDEFYGP